MPDTRNGGVEKERSKTINTTSIQSRLDQIINNEEMIKDFKDEKHTNTDDSRRSKDIKPFSNTPGGDFGSQSIKMID